VRSSAFAGSIAAAALVLAACAVAVPNPNDIAKSVELDQQGTTTIATVSPWPLDKTVAFFCLRQPGSAFSVANPNPPTTAGCTPANVSTSGDRLTAKLDPTSLDTKTAAAFAGQQQWFLAVAGSRGPIAVATSFTVLNIAKPS
jgi:hypothetical protein